VWQCSRATELCEQLATQPNVEAYVQDATGMPLSPYFTAAKFAWLLKYNQTVQNAATQQDLCLGTIDSWLIYQLTHCQSFKTELSNASRTQLLAIDRQVWDEKLCTIFGIPCESLAVIVDSDACFGQTDVDGILPHAVPIQGVLGDSQAALFGQHGLDVGDIKATYGTGSSIMMNLGADAKRSKNRLITSIGWRLDGQTVYVLEGNVNYSGAVIKWLQEDLQLIKTAAETATLAEQANPCDQTCLVPAFSGLGAPYWNNKAQAMFIGMTRTTRRPELVRAAVNSIALQINDVIQQMQNDCDCQCHQLKVDGGATSNPYLMQYQADITATQVLLPNFEELSAFGVVYAAGLAMAFYTPTTYQQDIQYQSYQPAMNASQRSSELESWQRAVKIVNENTVASAER